jgi:23S rRNA pseudouridine2605 synthase
MQKTVSAHFRLSKLIAQSGCCTRRQAEKWIAAGRVTVNDEPVRVLWASVSAADASKVHLDGLPLVRVKFPEPPRLFAVHKLRGEVLTEVDEIKKRPLLLERARGLLGPLLQLSASSSSSSSVAMAAKTPAPTAKASTPSTLKPVLWQDFMTEGLCILTNNGVLAKLMNDARTGLPRAYRVRVHGLVTESKLSGLRRGMLLDGTKYTPMEVTLEQTANTISWLHLRMTSARPHQIQNTLKALYLEPLRVICTEVGPFKLTDVLPRGAEAVELAIPPDVFRKLRATVGSSGPPQL